MPPSAVAQIQITAGTAGLAGGLRAAGRMLGGFGTQVASALRSFGKIPQFAGQAIGHFAGTLAVRGIDLLVKQGEDVLDFERKLKAFGLAARMSGTALRAVGNESRALSSSTGQDAAEVLRGARAYVDLAGAENYTAEKLSLIARAAAASGSDISDMATVVYSLSNALKVTGPELENTIGGLLNQSKSGAIHFSQMAQEMVSLAPTFAQFGIKGREGAIRLGAALQIVRTGFGSASEAGTGLQRLMRALPQHAKLFDKAGVQIFKKGSRSELLTLDEIMQNIYKSKLRLDRPALIKAFGRGEAERAFQLFLGASVEEYHKLIEAGRENGTVQADLADKMTSSTGRIDAAMQRAKNTAAGLFTPDRIEAFAGAVEDAVDKADGLFKVMSGIATVMGGFYRAGKIIRGVFTPGESRLASTSMDEAQEYAKNHQVSVGDAFAQLQLEHTARLHAQGEIAGAMKDDRTTPESNALAVKAAYMSKDVPGWQGARAAGSAYIEAAHLSPETVAEILKKTSEADVDTKISAGQGFSSRASPKELEVFNASLEKLNRSGIAGFTDAMNKLGPTIRDAIRQGMREAQTVLKLDGNPVAISVDNAPNRRRSP